MIRKNGMVDVRKLTVADAESYRRLRLQALEDHPAAFVPFPEEERKRSLDQIVERFENTWNKENNFLVGAFRSDKLIGMVGFYQYEPLKLRHKGQIWGMYVEREFQGQGLGKLILQTLIELVRPLEGLEQILLTVAADNERAKSLYDSLGFQVYGVEPRALRVKNQYIDEEHRVLFLGTPSGN